MKNIKYLVEYFDKLVINEMPERIDTLIIKQLTDLHQNKKLARGFVNGHHGAKKIGSVGPIDIYKSVFGKETTVVAIDSRQDGNTPNRVVYYVRWEVQSAQFIDTNWVTQVLVWRDRGCEEIINFSKTFFFSTVLKETGTILTDTQQTTDGEEYWKHLVPIAFNRGLKVYLVSFKNESVERIKTYTDFEKLCSNHNPRNPWGKGKDFQQYRVAISEYDFIQE